MAPNAGDAASYEPELKGSLPGWSNEGQHMWSTEAIRAGCCDTRSDLVPPWMEWVESGIEFFGCDESSPGKNVLGRAMMLRHNGEKEIVKRDFTKMHDQFIEALLYEQMNSSTNNEEIGIPQIKQQLSMDTLISQTSSGSSLGIDESNEPVRSQKRRRPLKLHRLGTPTRPRPNRVAPMDTSNSKSTQKNQSITISLSDIVAKEHAEPESYLHHNCKIQKDKGKGEPIGSEICAEGRSLCLEKLRQKMELLMQVAMGEERRGPAGMKRREARITSENAGYTETRSVIELRLGFLSMQYGILLRWDSKRTGKITFIVLRKMCHESFLSKGVSSDSESTNAPTDTQYPSAYIEPPPLVIRNVVGNQAIYQRYSGTEVMLVDPPYRVPQPEVFAPAVLSVVINNVAGLSRRSKWKLSLTFNGQTEVTQLHWNTDRQLYETMGHSAMDWELSPVSSFDFTGLEIRLFEIRKRRHGHTHLATTMTIPLGGLVVQPNTSQTTSWQVTIPCTHDAQSSVTLSFTHKSDYAHWLYKELEARRKEEVSTFVWKAPYRRVVREIKADDGDDDDDDDDALWEWICGYCFGA